MKTSFTLKAIFLLKIFKFLFCLFGYVEKRLEKRAKVNFKIYDATSQKTNSYNTRCKYNMKHGQFRSNHQRCSRKKVFLEISQNSRETTCARVYFLIKLLAACNLIKRETLAQVFSCEFCEISQNTFFTEHLWATASVSLQIMTRKIFFFKNYTQNVVEKCSPETFFKESKLSISLDMQSLNLNIHEVFFILCPS